MQPEVSIVRCETYEPAACRAALEAVLGASSVAKCEELALQAFPGERIALRYSESSLPGGRHHFGQLVGKDIAYFILRINEMVAAVNVAVVLYHGIASAGLGKTAGGRHYPAHVGESRIEPVYKYPSHIPCRQP